MKLVLNEFPLRNTLFRQLVTKLMEVWQSLKPPDYKNFNSGNISINLWSSRIQCYDHDMIIWTWTLMVMLEIRKVTKVSSVHLLPVRGKPVYHHPPNNPDQLHWPNSKNSKNKMNIFNFRCPKDSATSGISKSIFGHPDVVFPLPYECSAVPQRKFKISSFLKEDSYKKLKKIGSTLKFI